MTTDLSDEPLLVLHVEDEVFDVELSKEILTSAGFAVRTIHVADEAAFRRGLEAPELQLVFSDQSMPNFSGVEALRIAREVRPEVPFVFVSGSAREDDAIESIKAGASDYVLKHQLDGRLVPAVVNALRVSKERSRRKNTERKLRISTEALIKARSAEALGRLAGGVSHTFTNMLSVILGQVDQLLAEVVDSEESEAATVERLNTIRVATKRSADLTQNLLAFSRRQVLSPEPVDLNSLVRETMQLLPQVLGSGMAVCFEAGEVPAVFVDRTLLQQAIVNLAMNARDAMDAEGTLTLTSEVVEFVGDADRVGFVRLSVRDTGCGMSPEVVKHAFDPFYTTKADGKGTGLGLAGVQGFVSQSGGRVDLESAVGQGTTVRLLLPTTDQIPAAARPPEPIVPEHAQRSLQILLVEDEPLLRQLAIEVLRTAGHRVVTAETAEQALALATACPPDVVVTETRLPGTSGVSLAMQLHATHPEIGILFLTGFSPESHAANERRWLEQESFLAKPFSPHQLCAALAHFAR